MDLSPAEENVTFDFDYQVWRPSPTVNTTGCSIYSLVNNFFVASISIPVSPADELVAKVTPSPQDQLQFQPGDVLGFYVESEGRFNQDDGVVLLNSGSHTSELVWFASIDTTAQTFQSGSCPYPVGIIGVLDSLTRAAPVISMKITPYSCFHTTLHTPLIPAMVPKSKDEMLISNTMVAGIAVPLTLIVWYYQCGIRNDRGCNSVIL